MPIGEVAFVLERAHADRDRALAAHPREELVGERRLADPELALEHGEPAVRTDGAVGVAQRCPFAVALDERARAEWLDRGCGRGRGRDAAVADRVVQLGRGLERPDAELAMQRPHALAVLLERERTLAGARGEVHEAVVRRLVEGVELQPATRVLERVGDLPLLGQPVGEPVEYGAQLTRQPSRLERLPVVEGDAVAQPEAGEQLPAIELRRLGERRRFSVSASSRKRATSKRTPAGSSETVSPRTIT